MSAETLDGVLDQGVLQTVGQFCVDGDEKMMSICAKILCVVSGTTSGRNHIIHRKKSLAGLFSLIRSQCRETQLNCTKAVINLMGSEESRVVTANAGGLAVMRILTALGDFCSDVAELAASGASAEVVEARHTELREAKQNCEMAFCNALVDVVGEVTCHQKLIDERISSVLVLLALGSHDLSAIAAVRALSCFAFHKPIQKHMLAGGVVATIVWLVLSGQYLSVISEDVARILCYLSVDSLNRQNMVGDHAVPALIVLSKRVSAGSKVNALVALTLQYFSWSKSSQVRVVEDGAAKLLVQLITESHENSEKKDREVATDCAVAFANLSNIEELRVPLIKEHIIAALRTIVDSELINEDRELVWRMCAVIYHMSLSSGIRNEIAMQGGVNVLSKLASIANDAGQQMCAAAICNISKSKRSRERAVEDGAVEVLIALARAENNTTRKYCAIGLGNLSSIAKVEGGTVKALLDMNMVVKKRGNGGDEGGEGVYCIDPLQNSVE